MLYIRKDNAQQASRMLSKSRLTLLRSLRQKKFRREQGLFIAEGTKLVVEILKSGWEVKTVYAHSPWIKEHGTWLENAGETISVNEEEMSRISSLVTAPDVLAVVSMPEHVLDIHALKNKLTIVLDGIRDPGNMGTIIRIADWFGIDDIICSRDSAEMWNPKVVQASMGSLLRVRVHEADLEKLLSSKEFHQLALPVYGAFLDGTSVFSPEKFFPGMIVIGNESNGISEEVSKYITKRITIPSFQHTGQTGSAESLNAAVATAIIVGEFRRSAQ